MQNKNDFLRIAICDDEPIILRKITEIIKLEFNKQKINIDVFLFEKGEDIISIKNISDFDIIFLDIELKTTNGLDVAKTLRNASYSNLIIFITSFIDYVLDGYKADAFRFILKDNIESQLSECVKSISDSLKANKYKLNDFNLEIKDVLYVMSDNRTITIYMKNGNKKTEYMKLNDFEEMINSKFLYRVHQSYLINISFVEFITRYEVKLLNDISIPISKSRYKEANKEIKLRKKLWT